MRAPSWFVAGFGIALIAGFVGMAIYTADWRWLIGAAVCGVMVATKQ